MEVDARWREAMRKAGHLLWEEMFKIYLPLLTSFLPFLLLPPHPFLLPLFVPLLQLFPLHLFLLLLLSLLLHTSFILHLLPHGCNIFIHSISTVITISDMITVKIVTLTTVNIIGATSNTLLNPCAAFVINH